MCATYEISFVLLPPNPTHLCQPLEVSYFAPMKRTWRRILTEWTSKRRGPFQKSDFPYLLNKTLTELGVNSAQNLKSGFRTTGIIPLDSNQVLKRLPSAKKTDDESSNTALTAFFLDFLKETRMPEKKPARKRSKIKVVPGKTVEATINEEDSLNNEGEEVEDILREREKNNSDNENNLIENEDSESQIEIHEENNLVPSLQSFVIVKVPTATTSKFKYFVALVLEKYGEEEENMNYLVRYLRKRKTGEDVYFAFPNIPDESIIANKNVEFKLATSIKLRRERYKFKNIPKYLALE
ncbi:hypothetical protein Zmor_006132 [Zophobas morio]|uniref:DDE-1 domain-containing protein n=1 Tax=Zophobas morio TaxID=2755281 RepID=A0AA38ML64_9CUCU|nr:hypothetical protein Zmor_006132 [Zophobas morio]